jgi:hypothetical protein
VGSCHRSAIGRVVSGDDANSTLHHAPCAIAIAPRGYDRAGGTMDTIGVAYDGSLTSALSYLRVFDEISDPRSGQHRLQLDRQGRLGPGDRHGNWSPVGFRALNRVA